jgi:hypothetical protein
VGWKKRAKEFRCLAGSLRINNHSHPNEEIQNKKLRNLSKKDIFEREIFEREVNGK